MKTINDIQPGQGEEVIEPEKKVSARSQSRRVALQGLYQWQMTNEEIPQIIKQFNEDGLLEGLEFDWFKELISEVSANAEQLDTLYADYLDRAVTRIDPVERAILRIGSYELQTKIEIPYRVVINESVELAKRFGAEESHKYINGVLDKVAKQLRKLEMGL
ncbi:transcription antitermination factor NusB [Thiomicrorhabdus sediminis]|uniref:Transcription antitermination protein NusB n=1 Tax=Thiomicrorhabdus sediminis TaxID=2580412 RepID=A0A4V1HHW1_9GAMM|nr:transcription antitermination factor NusB [Thiomicrorhabdus sediminis]QCU90403.1 transcription antitermination factor NusB [Thiomicrorhabdus sediminis]